MTNTIYYDLYRDDTSESTNSSEVSQQLSIADQQKQPSLYSVISKAITAFGFQRSGLHQEITSNDERLQTPSLTGFSYKELKCATRNFRPDALLGQGHLTAKCDVYCFVVVLLQLFSGIGALGYNMRAGEYLLHWTKPHFLTVARLPMPWTVILTASIHGKGLKSCLISL